MIEMTAINKKRQRDRDEDPQVTIFRLKLSDGRWTAVGPAPAPETTGAGRRRSCITVNNNVGRRDEKRLLLVLDLDHTLLHSVEAARMSPLEERHLRGAAGAGVPDLLFQAGDLVTKLRPFVRSFLRESSKMYRLCICTMGTRGYAQRMARLLDPEGIYFLPGDVVSREDFPEKGKKSLAAVPGGDERTAVVLDDTAEVWRNHPGNLVPVPPYEYFGNKKKDVMKWGKRLSRAELGEDEDESAGVLASTLRLLTRVHRMFFSAAAGDGSPPPSSPSSSSGSGDVRRILSELKPEMPVAPHRRIVFRIKNMH